MQEGFDKTLEHMTWKDSFSMSQEIVEDAKLMDLRKRPAQFIAGYYRTREKFGAALYGAAITGKTSVSFHGRTFDAQLDGRCVGLEGGLKHHIGQHPQHGDDVSRGAGRFLLYHADVGGGSGAAGHRQIAPLSCVRGHTHV